MIRIANYTLHDQTAFLEQWRDFGFKMDPKPRATFVDFSSPEWTEERILETVLEDLRCVKSEGFEAILIGGLSNQMAYAWLIADRIGLAVYMAKTPRVRDPQTGKPVFIFTGVQRMHSASHVMNSLWDAAMREMKKNKKKEV